MLLRAPGHALAEICALTDGMPLALSLAVGRIQRFGSVQRGLEELREGRGAGSIDALCTFLFEQSWSELAPAAKGLMAYQALTTATSQSEDQLLGTRLNSSIVLDAVILADAMHTCACQDLCSVWSLPTETPRA